MDWWPRADFNRAGMGASSVAMLGEYHAKVARVVSLTPQRRLTVVDLNSTMERF